MTNARKGILFGLLFSIFCSATTYAATLTAASCNTSDVQSAINAVNQGDTVIIPNGRCTWNSGITTSKQINIQGQNKGSVILVMGTGITNGTAMLTVNTGTSFKTTISNINWMPGPPPCDTLGDHAPSGTCGSGSYIFLSGAVTDQPPLIHDNYFNVPGDFVIFTAITYQRYGGGVIYNNVFESTTNALCQTGPDTVGSGLGCGSQSGDLQFKDPNHATTSWSSADTMGTTDTTGLNNIYIEDNTFNNVGQSPDCDDGARLVFRHNTMNDSTFICHGDDTSAFGARHAEIYDNTWNIHTSGTWTFSGTTGYYPLNINALVDLRGGTMVVTGNVMPNPSNAVWGPKTTVKLHIEQIDRNAGPDACCPEGYACLHQVGRGQNNGPDPTYIWGNSGSGTPESPSVENSGYGQCTSNPNYNNPGYYIQLNRDYYTVAKPGWTRYTYPHPVRQDVGSGRPTAPTNLQVTFQ